MSLRDSFFPMDGHVRYIIKFVSVDGLTRFEERRSTSKPDEVLLRSGSYSRICAVAAHDGLPEPLLIFRRVYQLIDHGINSETGQYIFEYRERP